MSQAKPYQLKPKLTSQSQQRQMASFTHILGGKLACQRFSF